MRAQIQNPQTGDFVFVPESEPPARLAVGIEDRSDVSRARGTARSGPRPNSTAVEWELWAIPHEPACR